MNLTNLSQDAKLNSVYYFHPVGSCQCELTGIPVTSGS